MTALSDPVPAILEYIPYCKRDGTAARDEAMHPYFAGHGYAAIRVDLRGSGESEGVMLDEYLKQEQDDALEVIAWIAAQPWCTGRVGMMGKSWGGFNGLQVAARRPPALKAVISMYSTDDRYADDIHTMGGCLLNENANWSFVMFPLNARPPDPLLVGAGWETMWRERLDVVRPWIIGWLNHQRRDAFWKHGSVCEDYGAIQCPVYLIGGWADGYSNPVPRLMAGLTCPKKALIGPWGHQYQHQVHPGPKMGYMTEALRWWDHWLKDIDTGVMAEPAYRVWMNDSERPQTFYAHAQGQVDRGAGLAFEPYRRGGTVPGRRWPARRRCFTGTAVRAGAGDYGSCTPFWSNMGGPDPESPRDQRGDDALGLTFTGPALAEPLEIFGQPRMELELRGRPADRLRQRAPVRRAGRRRLDPGELRPAQPDPRRRARDRHAAGARPPLPRVGGAERHRAPLRGGQPRARLGRHRALAGGLALAAAGHTDPAHRGLPTGAAEASATGRGCGAACPAAARAHGGRSR